MYEPFPCLDKVAHNACIVSKINLRNKKEQENQHAIKHRHQML